MTQTALAFPLADPEPDFQPDPRFADEIIAFGPVSDPSQLGLTEPCRAFFQTLGTARREGSTGLWQKLFSEVATAADPERLHMVLPGSLDAPENAGRVYVPPADLPPVDQSGSAFITLADRQRTRFVVRDIGPGLDETGAADGLWLHLVMSIEMAAQDDPAAGIRVFQGRSDEETLVRFRDGGMVFLQEIRASLPPGGQPFALSIGIKDGVATVYVDGLPRHQRSCILPAITGFVVDISSQSERQSRTKFHAICLQRGGARPFWVTPEDEAKLANLVRTTSLTRPRGEQWRMLHALSGLTGNLPEEILIGPLNQNRVSEPFLPQLETLLLAQLPAQPKAELIPAPEPLVRIQKVVVSLASNPADHTLWPFGNRHESPARRVVNGVSLDAYKGDIIGILGRNGAGKSTLLKTMVGAMPLTEGRIEITGKAVLLRPGAGMQPTLTGRQNIIKAGLYMDLQPREIESKIAEIAAFAELEDHLDRPFKYYSDGMRSRLIFSIATAMPYDILLLDELLSAGDIGFQKRVTERLDQVIASAKLLFVVQHTFDFIVTRCTKCLVMEEGRPVFFGDPQIAAELYREKVSR